MENIEQIIAEIKAQAKTDRVPIVRDNTLSSLLELAKKQNPKKILEIGTAVGYSALNLLATCDCHLTTIEKNEQRFQEALSNFERAGVNTRVRAIEGDAMEVLQKLREEGEKFDLVFLDGPKGQYIKYLPIIKRLLERGAVIFADNVGLLGLVGHQELITHKNRTMVRNMQQFLQQIQTDEDFETKVFTIDDGYAVCRYKQKNDRIE